MIETKWFYDGDTLTDTHFIREVVFIDEQNVNREEEMDETDIGAVHLVVYDNKKPVATGRIIFIDGQCFLGRIATLKEERKKGYGDLTVRMLIRKAFEMGAEKQYIHAQISAQAFYEKIGFVEFGEPFMEANIPHVHMVHEGDISGNCCS